MASQRSATERSQLMHVIRHWSRLSPASFDTSSAARTSTRWDAAKEAGKPRDRGRPAGAGPVSMASFLPTAEQVDTVWCLVLACVTATDSFTHCLQRHVPVERSYASDTCNLRCLESSKLNVVIHYSYGTAHRFVASKRARAARLIESEIECTVSKYSNCTSHWLLLFSLLFCTVGEINWLIV